MVYFIRSLVVFLAVFIGLSIIVQQTFRHFYGENVMMSDAAIQFSSTFVQAPDTKSGLFLAGITAQNRRDWASAWQFFSTFNNNYHNNPQVALKAMTLALGNGSYDEALKLSSEIISYNSDEYPEIKDDSFDLARLLLLDAVKKKDMPAIETLKQNLEDGVLSQFAIPIIDDWIAATYAPDTLKLDTEELSIIQIYYKALAAEYAGKKDLAKSLMDSVEIGSISPNKILDIVAFYIRIGDRENAIKILENTADIFDNNVTVLSTLKKLNTDPEAYTPPYGSDFHMRGAEAALSMAFYDFSVLMLNEQASDSALLFVRLAAFLDNDSPSVFAMIGSILHAQGQLDDALINYQKVNFNDAEFEASLTRMVDILIEQKKLDSAKDVVMQAIEKAEQSGQTNAYFYYILGNIYKEKNEFDNAISSYDRAEIIGKQDGDMPKRLWPLYYARAITFDLSDQWPKAEADLIIAMEKFPNNPLILNYLGYAYADKNINLDKAKDMISRAVMMVPNDAYIIDSMGWILYRMGDYAEAVKYLERAAMLEPYHMVINDHLGDAYWKVGRKLEAKYMWQRAIDYYKEGDEEQDRMIEETRRKVVEGL